MLTGIPLLHYFECKNQYSGSHQGMRYLISPTKRKKVLEDGTEREEAVLRLDVWPDPWALERTDPTLRRQEWFALSEDGRKELTDRLSELYYKEEKYWNTRPDLWDSTPWTAPKEETEKL